MQKPVLAMLPPEAEIETLLVFKALEAAGFLTSQKIGKERIYQNRRLLDLLESMQ